MSLPIIIRDANTHDMPSIADIYAYYVKNSPSTFEEKAPSLDEITKRWHEVKDNKLPFQVACIDEQIIGYAYAFEYRKRVGYRYTLEESVYIKNGYQGKGIGKKLLNDLISRCSNQGYKELIAVITMRHGHDEDQVASLKLHNSCGFSKAGHLKKVGFKFDEWYDTILMQKTLRNN